MKRRVIQWSNEDLALFMAIMSKRSKHNRSKLQVNPQLLAKPGACESDDPWNNNIDDGGDERDDIDEADLVPHACSSDEEEKDAETQPSSASPQTWDADFLQSMMQNASQSDAVLRKARIDANREKGVIRRMKRVEEIRVRNGLPATASSSANHDFQSRPLPRSMLLELDQEFDKDLDIPPDMIVPGAPHPHGLATIKDDGIDMRFGTAHELGRRRRRRMDDDDDDERGIGMSSDEEDDDKDDNDYDGSDNAFVPSTDSSMLGGWGSGGGSGAQGGYMAPATLCMEFDGGRRVTLNPKTDDLDFVLVDNDSVTFRGEPPPHIPKVTSAGAKIVVRIMAMARLAPGTPFVSATVNVFNFLPYMYGTCLGFQEWVRVWSEFGRSERDMANTLLPHLRAAVAEAVSSSKSLKRDPPPYVDRVEIVHRSSVMGYDHGIKVPMMQVWVAVPRLIPVLRRIFELGKLMLPPLPDGSRVALPRPRAEDRQDHEAKGGGGGEAAAAAERADQIEQEKLAWRVFECNITFDQRFLVDNLARGHGWITLPKGKYTLERTERRRHWGTLEAFVHVGDLVVRGMSGKWNEAPDSRILSFDIECAGRNGAFPRAEHDPTIQICSALTTSKLGLKGLHQVSFSLGSSDGTLSDHDKKMAQERLETFQDTLAKWEEEKRDFDARERERVAREMAAWTVRQEREEELARRERKEEREHKHGDGDSGAADPAKQDPKPAAKPFSSKKPTLSSEYLTEGWDDKEQVFAYKLLRDHPLVQGIIASVPGAATWDGLYAMLREALHQDCQRLGPARVRALLAKVDARMRVERHARDHELHELLHKLEPWRFNEGVNHKTGFRRKAPRVPDDTGQHLYGWLDVKHMVHARSGDGCDLFESLAVLSYFFPRLRSTLLRGVVNPQDAWYDVPHRPERRAKNPIGGALQPSYVRANSGPGGGGDDGDQDDSGNDQEERKRLDALVEPQDDGVPGGTVVPSERDLEAAQAVGCDGKDAPASASKGRILQTVVAVLSNMLSQEARMLGDWAHFVRTVQPHVFTGYNITNFDFPYLALRAAVLGVRSFQYLGVLHEQVKIVRKIFKSRGTGAQERVSIRIGGPCVVLDMMENVRQGYKLASYSLNAVASHFLGRMKDDVEYRQITPLWESGDMGRSKLVRYCKKDALLPLELMLELQVVATVTEMVRVTMITVFTLMTRGQGVRTQAMLLVEAAKDDKVCPPSQRRSGDDIQYQGATVVQPKRGFYQDPVATLDFASLYPTIMLAHNLCFTTNVRQEHVSRFADRDLHHAPFGSDGTRATFVKSHVKQGLLPTILKNVLAARKDAKKQKKRCVVEAQKLRQRSDALANDGKLPEAEAALDAADKLKVEEGIWEARQLAYKVVANSVYGFCTGYILRMLEVGASVTYYGRTAIEHTIKLVEAYFCKANGFAHDAVVIYGDTDSVMVLWGKGVTMEEANELAFKAEHLLNKGYAHAGANSPSFVPPEFLAAWQGYPEPMEMEFEKVYKLYLLMNKKRYAGLMYMPNATKPKKIDSKGLATVRRDTAPYTRQTLKQILQLLMYNTVQEAVDYAVERGRQLLLGNVFMHELVISKGLAKLTYKTPQPHVEVYLQLLERFGADSAPRVGDRVPYILRFKKKKATVAESAIDPMLAVKQGIRPDFRRYFDSCFSIPVASLLLYTRVDPAFIHLPRYTKAEDERARTKAIKVFAGRLFGSVSSTVPAVTMSKPASKGSLMGFFTRAARGCAECGKPLAGTLRSRCQKGRASGSMIKAAKPAGATLDIEDLCSPDRVPPHIRSELCEACDARAHKVLREAHARASYVNEHLAKCRQTCIDCVNGQDWLRINACDNKSCDNLTYRLEAHKMLDHLKPKAKRLHVPLHAELCFLT